MSHYNIIVLEGGGARGPYEMGVLEVLERKAQKPIIDFTTLIASTSVGSVLSSFICTGQKSAAEWAQIVITEIPNFFKKKGLFCLPIYDKNNYVKCYEKYVKKGLLMSGLPIKLMITSVELCDHRVHFFKSWEEKDGDFPVVDVTMKSFSAPYFFGSTVDEKKQEIWLDGGMGLDNLPLFEVYIESVRQGWLNEGHSVNILAIGSGRSDERVPFKKAHKSNIFSQTINEYKTYIDLSNGGLARDLSTPEQARYMSALAGALPNLTFQFIDRFIPRELDKMDNVKARFEYYKNGLIDGEQIDISKFKF